MNLPESTWPLIAPVTAVGWILLALLTVHCTVYTVHTSNVQCGSYVSPVCTSLLLWQLQIVRLSADDWANFAYAFRRLAFLPIKAMPYTHRQTLNAAQRSHAFNGNSIIEFRWQRLKHCEGSEMYWKANNDRRCTGPGSGVHPFLFAIDRSIASLQFVSRSSVLLMRLLSICRLEIILFYCIRLV